MSSWSDVTTLEYVCLTAYYVDNDWKLRKRIINFRLIPLQEPDFSKSVLSCLRHWKIKKLFSMTLDNSLAKIIAPLELKWLDSIESTLERLREAIMYAQRFEMESKFYDKAEKLKVDTNKRSTTADMYFFATWKICMHLKKESKNYDPFISSLATKMQDMLDEYWKGCFVILAIAAVFNPRHKMLMVEFSLQKLYGGSDSADPYIKCVQDGIQKLYDEYDIPPSSPMDTDDTSSSSSNGDRDQFDNAFLQDYQEFLEKYYLTLSQKSELEFYLEEKVLPSAGCKFNVLTFWKLTESRFPKLARLAHDVLAIPIVAVASDSVFHIGDRVLEERYSSMGSSALEARICMQNWLQESYPPQATILDGGVIFDVKDYEQYIEVEEEEEEEEETEDQEEDQAED